MSAQVSVFLKKDQVIIVPQGGGGGLSFDIEPLLIVPAAPDEVQRAIEQALVTSTAAQGDFPPPKQRTSSAPLLKKLGCRSFKEFYRGSSHCYVYEEEGQLVMLRFKPANDGKGFDLTTDLPETIEERNRVGLAILNCLQNAQAMPG